MPDWEQQVATRLAALRLDSIRHRILAFAVLATLIPSVITGTISYLENRRSLTAKITDQLNIASAQSAREVDLWLKEKLNGMRSLASSYEVSENLARAGRGTGTNTSTRRLNDYLYSVRGRLADYEELMVVDLGGHVVASSAKSSRPVTFTREWLAEIRGQNVAVGQAYQDTAVGKVLVLVGVPVGYVGDRPIGALAAKLSLRPAAGLLGAFLPGDSGGIHLITGQGGLMLAARDSAIRPMSDWLENNSTKALFDGAGKPVEFSERTGRELVGVLQPVHALNGAVVATLPQTEAYRQVTRLRNVTVLMVGGLLLGVGGLAYLLALVIVRPLDRLTAGAAKVAAGDLDVDIPVVSSGEVGYLTEVFNDMVARLRESRAELERLSVTDGLTGLFNRRRLMEALAAEARRAERTNGHFSILMVDVDHFKLFNDTYGHPAGDAVLARVATILREAIREADLAARYGGEEFLLLLTGTDTAGALEVAERIRARLATEAFDGGAITVSVGVAQFPEGGATAEALIMNADAALYQAKKEGRDRVVRAPASAK